MDEQTVVYPYKGALLCNKNKHITGTYSHKDEPQMH